jgi:hypothetical protein
VLATTDHGAGLMPLSLRPMIVPARRHPTGAVVSCRIPAPAPSHSANLCPGCGPVANELSSRFCGQHGAALRSAVAAWRARSAQASA